MKNCGLRIRRSQLAFLITVFLAGHAAADSDNASTTTARCGNGIIEKSERCETEVPMGQPGLCPAVCDDENPCTQDTLLASGTCDAHCEFLPVKKCSPETSGLCVARGSLEIEVDAAMNDSTLTSDHLGSLHLAYVHVVRDPTNPHYHFKNDLQYVTNVSGKWTNQSIPLPKAASPRFLTLAVDAVAAAHLIYFDVFNKSVTHLTNATGSWIVNRFAPKGKLGSRAALAVDTKGSAHVLYTDEKARSFRYVTNASGNWEVSPISLPVKRVSALSVDEHGNLHFVYVDERKLKYMSNAGGQWTTRVVTMLAGYSEESSARVARDFRGKFHVLLIDRKKKVMSYMTNATGKWTTTAVPSRARSKIEFHVDRQVAVHILQSDVPPKDGNSVYITNSGHKWTVLPMDKEVSAMTVTGDGRAQLAQFVRRSNVHGVEFISGLKFVSYCP